MTTSDKLSFTLKEVMQIEYAHENNVSTHPVWPLAKQLAATMRENERLRTGLKIAQALTKKYLNHINFDDFDDREITELREIHYQATDALEQPNKDPSTGNSE